MRARGWAALAAASLVPLAIAAPINTSCLSTGIWQRYIHGDAYGIPGAPGWKYNYAFRTDYLCGAGTIPQCRVCVKEVLQRWGNRPFIGYHTVATAAGTATGGCGSGPDTQYVTGTFTGLLPGTMYRLGYGNKGWTPAHTGGCDNTGGWTVQYTYFETD